MREWGSEYIIKNLSGSSRMGEQSEKDGAAKPLYVNHRILENIYGDD